MEDKGSEEVGVVLLAAAIGQVSGQLAPSFHAECIGYTLICHTHDHGRFSFTEEIVHLAHEINSHLSGTYT